MGKHVIIASPIVGLVNDIKADLDSKINCYHIAMLVQNDFSLAFQQVI